MIAGRKKCNISFLHFTNKCIFDTAFRSISFQGTTAGAVSALMMMVCVTCMIASKLSQKVVKFKDSIRTK